jgi:hypothetical protein
MCKNLQKPPTNNIDIQSILLHTYQRTISHLANHPPSDLLAACALSFKPLFHRIAKSLHLSQLVTHTCSYVWKQNKTGDGKATDSENSAYFDNLKSSDIGDFSKLHLGSDPVDEEVSIGMKNTHNQVRVSVIVTRSRAEDEKRRDMQHESSTTNERYVGNGGVGTFS